MGKNIIIILGILLAAFSAFVCSTGCKNNGPSTPYDIAFTPTPVRIYGAVNVFVEDKGIAVPNLVVKAIPPSGVTVFSQATTASGIAIFNPPYLEVGNWTFVVPAQTPFPFAPSTITMPVSVVNETANFNSAGATLYLTPTVPESFTSTNPGSPYTFNLIYSQPGNLFVPAKIAFSPFPNNWSGAFGPATIGFGNADTGTVTVIANNCVDQQPSFAVTALDFEPTPYPRAFSAAQTIVKNFSSNAKVTVTNTLLGIGTCGSNYAFEWSGELYISATDACSSFQVWFTSGNCCLTNVSMAGQSVATQDCGGPKFTLGPGNYGFTMNTTQYSPTLYVSFEGQSGSVAVPVSGGNATAFNYSY